MHLSLTLTLIRGMYQKPGCHESEDRGVDEPIRPERHREPPEPHEPPEPTETPPPARGGLLRTTTQLSLHTGADARRGRGRTALSSADSVGVVKVGGSEEISPVAELMNMILPDVCQRPRPLSPRAAAATHGRNLPGWHASTPPWRWPRPSSVAAPARWAAWTGPCPSPR